jgi:hypothetical protein
MTVSQSTFAKCPSVITVSSGNVVASNVMCGCRIRASRNKPSEASNPRAGKPWLSSQAASRPLPHPRASPNSPDPCATLAVAGSQHPGEPVTDQPKVEKRQAGHECEYRHVDLPDGVTVEAEASRSLDS